MAVLRQRPPDGRFPLDLALRAEAARLPGAEPTQIEVETVSHDDRAAVLRQVAALQAVDPKLVLVPGHDGAAIGGLIRTGALTPGFRF